MPLSPKQARFVAEYLIDLSAKQAAIRAGYSEKTAKQQGCRLLTYPEIAAAIAEGRARISGELEVSAESVVAELAKIGFAPIGHKHVKVTDKRAALADLGKHLGIFTEKAEIDQTVRIISDRPMTADEWAERYATPANPVVPASRTAEGPR